METSSEQTPVTPERITEDTSSNITPWQLVTTALRDTWQQPRLVGWHLLMLVVSFVPLMIGMMSFLFGMEGAALAVAVPAILALAVIAMIVISVMNTAAVLFAVTAGGTTTYWQGWKLAWSRLWSFLVLGFLSSLVLLTGSVLFVIPAIVVGVYIALSQIVFAKEEVRGIDALVRSTELVRGCWWGTFFRLLLVLVTVMFLSVILEAVTALLGAAGEMVALIAGVAVQAFTTVFVITAMVLWYHERVAVVGVSVPNTNLKRWYVVAAWVGALFMLVLPLLVGGVLLTQFKDEIVSEMQDDFGVEGLNVGTEFEIESDI